jgi:sugar phosphate isomerase/epimerase
MRLSVTSWSFPALTLAESWAVAQALGFSAIDVGLHHGPALDRAAILSDPEGQADRLRSAGITAANLYWMFGEGPADRAVTDPAARALNEADFSRVCRFAARAAIPSVFVLPGVLAPGITKGEALAASAASLRDLHKIAHHHGVLLTVEPHVMGLLTHPDDALQLLSAVPGMKLCLDYAHFVCLGHTQAAIDAIAPHAGHVHLRQARPGALQAKWGEGTIDFAAVLDRLKAAGYQGWCAVEYVHQAYMNTLTDDVLTETVRMRDLARAWGVT